ncbi:hypothetical protein [Micromonospora sediminicola]|uniref:hypothetical protein n=1 Tax=Micromonospora sediminicola TaxID=946078 RepID=UPI0037A9E15A
MTLIEHLDHLQAAIAAAPAPDPGGGEAPPGVGDKVLTLLKWVAYLATAACVGGVLYTAAKMALSHRRGDDTNLSQLGWVFAACILIGSASAVVSALI